MMFNDLKRFFYGIVKVNNVEFINKLKPNYFVRFVEFFKSYFKYVYYNISIKNRFLIFKKFINLQKYHNSKFRTVYFELRTRCNSQCSFCMASILTDSREDETMSLDLYKKIINDLAEKDFNGTIGFYVNNEPLLVKNLDQYITIARSALPDACLRILTNGLKLNPKNGTMLLECGINEIEVNVYQSSIKSKIPRGIYLFENEVIQPLVKKHNVRAQNTFKYKNNTVKYYKILRQINEILTTRGGSAPNTLVSKKKYDGFCSYPFWQLNITADGRVAQCCADFYFESSNLNCKDRNIYEIWNSDFFQSLRSDLLQGNRSNNNLCKECDFCGENPRNVNSILSKIFLGMIT